MLFSSSTPAFRRQLNLTTALLALGTFGYGARGAYAGSCAGVSPTYSCVGAPSATGTDLAINLTGNGLNVTAQANFGHDRSAVVNSIAMLLTDTGVGDLTLTSAANGQGISGQSVGIFAENQGGGSLNITTTGLVRSTVNSGSNRGISLSNDANGANINLTTESVSGRSGIYSDNLGNGSTTIDTIAGTVTGGPRVGIYATNRNSASVDMTITTGAVSAGLDAIRAVHSGTGVVDIEANGQITATGFIGIHARNTTAAIGDMTVIADGVEGRTFGIYAYNYGTGLLSITASGLVESTGSSTTGIEADSYGQDLLVDVGDVTAGRTGINAFHYSGSGSLIVRSGGTVSTTSTGGNGIAATSGTNGSFMHIDVNNVTGDRSGISVSHYGSGNLLIDAVGQVSGTAQHGIFAYSAVGDVIMDVVDVTGGWNGIYVDNLGVGATNITVSGTIVGGSTNQYAGIATAGINGATTLITLNNMADISAGTGIAIRNDQSDSTVNVNSGATIRGDVLLDDGGSGYGNDDLNFYAGSIVTQFEILDGGDDDSAADGYNDILNFTGATGTTSSTAEFRNWEVIFFDAAADITLSNSGLFNAPERLDVVGGSRFRVDGDFDSDGLINMLDGDPTDTLSVGGTFNILGTDPIRMDVDFDNDLADTIVIDGIVTGGLSQISLNAISAGLPTGNDILLIDTGASGSTGDFQLLNNAPISVGSFIYDLVQMGDDWFLSQVLPTMDNGTFESYQSALLDQSGLTTYAERVGARYFDGTGENLEKRFALWSRIEGATSDVGTDGSESDASYELNQRRIEAGFDVVLGQLRGGTVYAGLNGGIGQSALDAVADGVTGTADSDVYTVGATLTYAGHNGFYADAQVKHVWFESDLADDTGTSLVDDTEASALIAGLEVGQSVMVSDNLTLTPQAQLTYASLDVDDFTASTGQAISFDDADSLALRLGVSAKAGLGTDGSLGSVKVISNVTHELLGKTEGDADGTAFSRDRADWTGELGLQFAVGNAEDGISLHGGASLSGDLENLGDTHTAKGNLGVRVKM